jgi:hypothetical protein
MDGWMEMTGGAKEIKRRYSPYYIIRFVSDLVILENAINVARRTENNQSI